MDVIKNTHKWVRGNVDELFTSLSTKIDDVDEKMTHIEYRIDVIESKIDIIGEQNKEMIKSVDSNSVSIESVMNLYKKDMNFRNKITLFVVVFLIIVILFVIH